MAGSISYAMADVYGTGYGTTETTIPEDTDQQALVDDQKAAGVVSDSGVKKVPILAAIAMLVVIGFLMGVIKA